MTPISKKKRQKSFFPKGPVNASFSSYIDSSDSGFQMKNQISFFQLVKKVICEYLYMATYLSEPPKQGRNSYKIKSYQ